MLMWCHGIAMISSFNTYQKVQTFHDIIADFPQIVNLQWNIGQIEFLAKIFSKFQNFTGLLLIKEGNDISNIYCKIQDHNIKIFVKIMIPNIAWLHPPPRPLILTVAYPTPG